MHPRDRLFDGIRVKHRSRDRGWIDKDIRMQRAAGIVRVGTEVVDAFLAEDIVVDHEIARIFPRPSAR